MYAAYKARIMRRTEAQTLENQTRRAIIANLIQKTISQEEAHVNLFRGLTSELFYLGALVIVFAFSRIAVISIMKGFMLSQMHRFVGFSYRSI